MCIYNKRWISRGCNTPWTAQNSAGGTHRTRRGEQPPRVAELQFPNNAQFLAEFEKWRGLQLGRSDAAVPHRLDRRAREHSRQRWKSNGAAASRKLGLDETHG